MPFAAHHLFFGLALVQGALNVLTWAFSAQPAANGVAWHAHEMVFGHALAVVGGFLFTRLSRRASLLVATMWVAARVTYLAPATPAELRAALSIASTAAVALPAALAFLRGAKRSANFAFPILLGGLVAADILFRLGELDIWRRGQEAGRWLSLGIVVLLIVAMGGRLIGAAASGASQRAGGARIAPQPWLERMLLALLTAGFAAEAFAVSRPAGPMLLAAGGTLIGFRVLLWAAGLRRSAGDILALAAGQGWLALGLIAWSISAMGLLPLPETAALHLATIGGIGGTTLVMVTRVAAQRGVRPMPIRAAPAVAGLLGLAAVLRAFGPPGPGWEAAAMLWTAATLVAAASAFAQRR